MLSFDWSSVSRGLTSIEQDAIASLVVTIRESSVAVAAIDPTIAAAAMPSGWKAALKL